MTGGTGDRAAIVFDMDGVLVDTEPLKARAHRSVLEARGGELPLELYRDQMGGAHRQVIRTFLHASGLDAGPEAVEDYEEGFRGAYRDLLERELRPVAGARDLLRRVVEEERAVALVTSSERWMVRRVLPRLGAEDVFRAVVTAEDVEREKPAPDPYLRARSALGADSDRAVAVEDTRSGVAAASAAGLVVVAVRHEFNRDQVFPRAAAEAEQLTPAEDFLSLVDRVADRSG